MPRVELDTRVLVVQHAVERFKPTSTARLLLSMFPNSALVVYGAADERFAVEELSAGTRESVVLFPGEDALPLQPRQQADGARAQQLVVLDGTWSQCARMARRVPIVRTLPQITLPEGPPSPWTVRRSADPTRLCTFEATLRAIAIREGVTQELVAAERCFQRVTARALYMRSRLAVPETPSEWGLYLAS